MRKASFASFLFLLAITLGADSVSAQINAPLVNPTVIQGKTPNNQVVVVFKEKPSVLSMLSVTDGNSNLTPEYGLTAENSMVYTVRDGNISGTVESIGKNARVSKVFPNYHMSLLTIPNDTYIAATPEAGKPKLQWNMFNLKLADSGKSAWDVSKGASSIVVAAIDSGVDSSHPDLTGKFSSLVDCVSGCREVTTMTDSLTAPHGTHVSGLVAASTNNSVGIAGSGYDTRIMMVKVMNTNGDILLSDVINGVKWAADHGARVINMSLGQIEENLDASAISSLGDATSYAWSKGALVVAAAGNCGGNTDGNKSCAVVDAQGTVVKYVSNSKSYPGASPNVLAVAALTPDNNIASYSEINDASNSKIGNWISVAAPGGNCSGTNDAYNCILSTIYTSGGDKYGYMSGTSQASPQVAGIAALMLALNPNMTNAEVKSKIETTANKSIGGTATINGMVDALAAVSAVTPLATATPSPTPTGSNVTPSPTGAVTPILSLTPTGIESTPTATPISTPSATPISTPSATIIPSPTLFPTQAPKLPKTAPVPFPPGPYCPSILGCPKKEIGDANCDGFIDKADYKILLEQFDTMVSPDPANLNANFSCREDQPNTYFVDLVDFEIWRRYAGSIPGGISPVLLSK